MPNETIDQAEVKKAVELLNHIGEWLKKLPTNRDSIKQFDAALNAVYKALTETRIYQKHLRDGSERSDETEELLVKLWGEASSEIRPYDQELGDLCWVKGQGWADRAVWEKPEYKELPIELDQMLDRLRNLSRNRRSILNVSHSTAAVTSWLLGGLILLFLMILIVLRPSLTDDQRVIARLLMSLSVALLALFFVGGVLMKGPLKGVTISATGGFALFILLQFVYDPFKKITNGNGVIHIRVTVIDPQEIPVDDAKVWSTIGGEPKKVAGGWQFDVAAVNRPPDGKLTVYASRDISFLTGKADITLTNESNSVVTIKLKRDDTARVRGQVVDGRNRGVVGARVFVVGHESEGIQTREGGNFDLPAHAARDQKVLLHAEKARYRPAKLWHPAGDTPAVLVIK